MARLTSQLVAQTEHNQMLPKLKIGLTAFGEKNNKQTNERTNGESKNKQTNKQHRKTIPSSLAIVRSITL